MKPPRGLTFITVLTFHLRRAEHLRKGRLILAWGEVLFERSELR